MQTSQIKSHFPNITGLGTMCKKIGHIFSFSPIIRHRPYPIGVSTCLQTEKTLLKYKTQRKKRQFVHVCNTKENKGNILKKMIGNIFLSLQKVNGKALP